MSLFDFATLSDNHKIVTTADEMSVMVRELNAVKTPIAWDLETSGLEWWHGCKPIGIAFGYLDSDSNPHCFYMPVRHKTFDEQADLEKAKIAFKDVMSNAVGLIGHNEKFDLNMARSDGWFVDTSVPLHDTMIQAYLIDENRYLALEKVVEYENVSPYGNAFTLKNQVEDWIKSRAKSLRLVKRDYLKKHGHEEVPVRLEAEYACRDVGHTLALHENQYARAMGKGKPYEHRRKILYYNEQLLIRALADMEYQGQKLDIDYLERAAILLDQKLDMGGKELSKLFGVRLDWNNDTQIRELIFDRLDLPIVNLTAKQQASVDRSSLSVIAHLHPGIDPLLSWRANFKVRSTYTGSLISHVDKNNRLHASFSQVGTKTGRLSSRYPNLQNIPSRDKELSRLVRRAFVVDEGMSRIFCDYSQIELRMLAFATDCKNLVDAYMSKAYDSYCDGLLDYDGYVVARANEKEVDVHSLVAERVFKKSKNDHDFDSYRRQAKAINFAVPYGGGHKMLANKSNMLEAEAKKWHRDYHIENPEIEQTKRRLLKKMRRSSDLAFINWASRSRHGPKLSWTKRDDDHCPVAKEERSMFASLIQGSAGELTRFSIVKLFQMQQSGDLPAITTSTVHDEIQVDCSRNSLSEISYKVRKTMEDFCGLFGGTPIIANLESTSSTWADKESLV